MTQATSTFRFPLLIDNERQEGAEWKSILSPFDGRAVSQVAFGSAADLDRAIAAAEKAFHTWKNSSRFDRASLLRDMAVRIKARRQEFVDCIVEEGGKPRTFASAEVERCLSTFTAAAEEARRQHGEEIPLDLEARTKRYFGLTVRRPLGVIAAVTPFNFPVNLVAHKLAPALATGNTMVIKPASQTPSGAHLLAEVAVECGVPPGVVNVVPCNRQVGNALATDPRIRMLSFTGSSDVGWALQRQAVRKRVVLELGGNAAVVVHSDANLETAVQRCVAGGFGQAGQSCISVQRILVQRDIYESFLARLTEAAQACPSGDPREDKVVVGPVIDRASAERLEAWVGEAKAAGAKVMCGGTRKGSVFEATVLANTTRDMKVNSEEVFGPVVTVTPYERFEDALAQVNDSAFGLQAGVFTQDIKRAWQALNELEVGGVLVNDVPTQRVDTQPYGGVKDSGLGREGLRYAMDEMTEIRILMLNLA
ncbi:MAG TPA: aldehyde dehydrogenase family protein [Candidatus Xenobia bacterium]|jgi:glyceraldehyde-3-phosphate dehydrogenase (NADP+)